MPRKSASREEIEVVFGFKQVLGTAVLAVFALGCAYLVGYERGHTRARQGKPSLLAVLEGDSGVPGGDIVSPVRPHEPGGDTRGEGPQGDPDITTLPKAGPTAAPGGESETRRPARQPVRRAKPTPGIKPGPPPEETVAEPARPPAARPAPTRQVESVDPPAGRGQNGRLHYQVAAMGQRTNAKALVDWLRAEGFQAGIRPAPADGLYRVFVGPFRNDREAQHARDRLSTHGFQLMARRF